MIIKVPKELKEQCWEYLQVNNMGNRHSANGSKEEQFVGLIGEILTKNYLTKNIYLSLDLMVDMILYIEQKK